MKDSSSQGPSDVRQGHRTELVDHSFDDKGPTISIDDGASNAPVLTRTESSGRSTRPDLPIVGSRIAQYELIRKLGQGGMGAVYLARDLKLGRLAALKFLAERSPKLTERFLTEARATARCRHEHIVVIYDHGHYQGFPYMALEYVEGQTLRAWMRDHADRATDGAKSPVSVKRAVELIVPVVRALVVAHGMGITHRDLKPENIMIAESGAIKVLDFGIAKLQASRAGELDDPASPTAGSLSMTQTGAMIGTLPYMSPEQLRGQHVDHRSDLWAVGVILYELAVGRHPLAPMTREALVSAAHAVDEPMPSASADHPHLGALGAIIDRCLIKRKADRTGSAQDLLAELEPLLPTHRALVASDDSPFAGLAAFQESDAGRFFGRTREIASAVARLREHSLIAVVGPSGTGKSSFVRAGVIPALKLTGDGWDAFVVRPGRRPLDMLASLLSGLNSSIHPPDRADADAGHAAVVAKLRAEPGFVGAQLRARANRNLRRTVLFVDQFEELYTMGADADERAAFVACLAGVADHAASPLRVMISLRSDFLDRVAESREFMAAVTQGLVFLRPIAREGLREALTRPLELTDYQFENHAMVEQLIASVEDTHSALPLLQFTAAKLWDARDRARRLLTRDSYDAMGGIAGALSCHADAVIAAMSSHERTLARRVVERLVTPERTRALASMSELRGLPGDPDAIERVVHRLVSARLVVVETGGDADSGVVELVHESLIQSWPTLGRWLDEHQEDSAFLTRLRTAAKQWDSNGRPQGMLWREEAMRDARQWHARHHGELPSPERDYITAVFAVADRSTRRRRWMIGTAGAVLVLVAVAMSYFAWQESSANRRANQAVQAANLAAEQARRSAARANREADVAREVSGFLVDLFNKSDPNQAQGDTITAREILDEGADRIDDELSGQPNIQATLKHTIGTVYINLGLYDRAERLLQSALALRREVHGPDHIEVAETLDSLGEVLIRTSSPDAAEALLREALDIRTRTLGADHPSIAGTHTKLGDVLFISGQYAASEQRYQAALVIERRAPAADQQSVAFLLHKLALTAANQGQLAASNRLFDESLSIYRQAVGEHHPLVIDMLANIAFWRQRQGDFDLSEQHYRRVLTDYKRLYGDAHPYTAFAAVNMADLLNARERHREAEALVRSALDVARAKVPQGNWRIALANSVLGASLAGQQRYREAEQLLLDSYPIIQASKGMHTLYTADALRRIVELYRAWRLADKEAHYRDLLTAIKLPTSVP